MIYSYKITRDYGFAPNPFFGVCTLATCKPDIRRSAEIGDWIVGFGSSAQNSEVANKIIYIMKVEKVLTFDEYWSASEYQCKKPVMNGSLKQNYGDNIYHQENGEWKQEDSHHSLPDGSINLLNLSRDTRADRVLISTTFWYFGANAIDVLPGLSIIPECRNYRKIEGLDEELETWTQSFEQKGFIGEPAKFKGEFSRYNGK